MSRRHALLALACATVALGGCGDDDEAPAPASTPLPTATASATPSPEATAEAALDQALWPPPEQAVADPVEAARSFVQDYIGIGEAHLGEFLEGEPGAGEVEVFRAGEDGSRLDTIAATLSLRRLDDTNWFVTSAQSPEVELTAPEPLAVVSSPVPVEGQGRGFEGNIVLEVRPAFTAEPLVQTPVTAGAMEGLEPFSAELEFEAPGTGTGAIVARTGSGVAATDGFAALPVRFQ